MTTSIPTKISEQVLTEPNIDTGDDEYESKARVLNIALQQIGMGKYQWFLFALTGFGYFSDNAWPIVTGLILPAVIPELTSGPHGPFLKLGQNLGLLIGAAFWGVGADIWGRKISFTLTLLITGVFAFCAAFSKNFVTLTSLAAAWSVGVGGNLPVDSSIFLEFLPGTHQYLLTVLSIWWAFGQLLTSLIAWPLLSKFSCPQASSPESSVCHPQENRGWRYLLITLSLLTLSFGLVRIFLFKLYESPKFLMGRGREEEAVEVVKKIAKINGVEVSLHVDDLIDPRRCQKGEIEVTAERGDGGAKRANSNPKRIETTSGFATAESDTSEGHGLSGAIRRGLTLFDTNHVKALFSTRKLSFSTTILILLWALIGLAFPLYNSFVTYYLATRGAHFGDGSTYITYRNQVILSMIGVPGALLAGYMVELPLLGRRGTLSLSTFIMIMADFTVLTGVFILLSLTSRSSSSLLGWNCAYSFTSNIMYGVLYALTPELFPTRDRGTGNALCAGANRVFGVMAPIIALYANITTSVPIFISGAIFVVAGLIALLLPYDSRGRPAL